MVVVAVVVVVVVIVPPPPPPPPPPLPLPQPKELGVITTVVVATVEGTVIVTVVILEEHEKDPSHEVPAENELESKVGAVTVNDELGPTRIVRFVVLTVVEAIDAPEPAIVMPMLPTLTLTPEESVTSELELAANMATGRRSRVTEAKVRNFFMRVR